MGNGHKTENLITHGITIVITLTAIILLAAFDLKTIPDEWVVNLALDVFGMVLCIVLSVNSMIEPEQDNKTRDFTRMVVLVCFGFFADFGSWIFEGTTENIVKLVNTVYFFNGNLMLVSFWNYIRKELGISKKTYRNKAILICILTEMTLLLVNWGIEIFFDVSDNGKYTRTSLFLLLYISPIFLWAIAFFSSIRQRMSRGERMALLSYLILPMGGAVVQYFVPRISILYEGFLISFFIIYCQIHLNRSRIIVEQRAELSKKNMALMVSQIQPHFLYNTLTTISNLCRKNPKEAEEMTVMFSHYLRTNLDSIKNPNPVPFAMELSHVQTYLEIEKKRFGDKLNIVFDIKDRDFYVPALSIQPIVENSVKHGICEKLEPGTVYIRTYTDGQEHVIEIEDDGVGFDMNAPAKDDGRTHLGMSNVKSRLEEMVGAKVTVVSSPGNGCRTTVRIGNAE